MVFWVAAAALAALTGWFVVFRAVRRAAAPVTDGDLTANVYRRQISEIDGLAEVGLLGPEEQQAARAEAGRRLLATSPAEGLAERAASPHLLILVLAGTLTGALALYWMFGEPGRPDAPYAGRLEQWRTSDLAILEPAKVAALLKQAARTRPDDPTLQLYLGRARLQAGDFFGAADSFRSVNRLAAGEAEAHRLLGEALIQATPDGPAPAEAEAAFTRALQIDSSDAASRYFLGEIAMRRGDLQAAGRNWALAKAMLPADDPRRTFLDRKTSEADRLAAAGSMDDQAITGMVRGLAERLRSNPDDAEGWARLVRSYGVLGRFDDQRQALASARQALADRPVDLAKVEAEASGATSDQAAPR